MKDRYDGLALQLLCYQGHYLLFRRDVDTKKEQVSDQQISHAFFLRLPDGDFFLPTSGLIKQDHASCPPSGLEDRPGQHKELRLAHGEVGTAQLAGETPGDDNVVHDGAFPQHIADDVVREGPVGVQGLAHALALREGILGNDVEPGSQQRPRHAGEVHVFEEDPAPGTVDEGQEGEQQRRLPGAATSANRDPLAGADRKGDVFQAPRGVPGAVGGVQVLESQVPSHGPVGRDLDGRDDLLLGRRISLERLDPRDRAQGRLQRRPGADEVRQPGAQRHEVQESDADRAASGGAARGHRHAHDDDREAGYHKREHEPQPGLHGEEEIIRLLRPVEALAELGEQQPLPPVGADGGEAGVRLRRLGLQPGLGLQVQLPELLGRAEVDVLDKE